MHPKIVFEPSDDGGYTAYVPALPGCISQGDSLEKARENFRAAIALYLEPDEAPFAADAVVVEELAV